MTITVNCGALLLAAAEMFNCGMRIRGISCHSKNSADSLSLLKNRGSPNSSKENSCLLLGTTTLHRAQQQVTQIISSYRLPATVFSLHWRFTKVLLRQWIQTFVEQLQNLGATFYLKKIKIM